MMERQKVVLEKNVFDRWIIVNEEHRDRGWSGARWIAIDAWGLPMGLAQVSNQRTREDAQAYAVEAGFTVVEK
jgi:hypothetical protein